MKLLEKIISKKALIGVIGLGYYVKHFPSSMIGSWLKAKKYSRRELCYLKKI